MRTTKFMMLLLMLLLTANAWGAWSYTSKGNAIAAYGEGSYTKDSPLMLTLTAPADLMFNGKNKPATLAGSDAWTAAGLTLPTIYYNGLTDQPRALGDYTASISVGGVTAKCTFTIATVIEYKSIFKNGINEGTNYDIVEGTGAYTVPLNDSEKRGVYWDDDEKCAVFDGEAYLMIDNPLGNANASTGFTLSIETYISSENDNKHPYINVKGNSSDGGGWQRLFDLSNGTKDYYFFLNAGVKYVNWSSTGDEGNHLLYAPKYGSESRVYNNTNQKFFDKWVNVTLVVAPGGYGTLYVDGEKLTYNSSNSIMTNVLNNISTFDKCYIGTSIFEVLDGCDGLLKGKIRGFDIAEGALLPYYDGSSYHYLLTYDTNGGDKITGSFQTSIPSSLPTPTRTGFTFQGWYMDRNFTTAATSGTALTANTTLYAKWNSVTFDEVTVTKADITNEISATPTNVVIGRTFYKDGGNNTICLPFSLTADQIAASPLAGYTKLQEFTSAEIVNKGEDDETLELAMTDVTSIEAGKPYIIAWAKGDNLVSPAFTNVTISTAEPSKTAKSGGVEFCGVLAPFSMETGKQYMFVGTGAQLKWPKADGWFKGFSGYFTVDLSSSAKLFRGMNAYLVDGTETGISSVNSDQLTVNKVQKLLEQGKVVIISNGKRYSLDGKPIE